MIEEVIKTCLHRAVGDCPDCERDYESKVNNTHCPKYYEINLVTYENEYNGGEK